MMIIKDQRFFFILLMQVIFFSFELSAKDKKVTVVAVGEPQIRKEKISILPIYADTNIPKDLLAKVEELNELFLNDFNFYRKNFDVPSYRDDSVNIVEKSKTQFNSPNFEYWLENNTDYLLLVRAQISSTGANHLELTALLYDIRKRTNIFRLSEIVAPNELRKKGHMLANGVYKGITGKESIFNSQLTFVSDFGSSMKEPIKELYLMDFDGKNVQRLTNHQSIVISPSISKDKKRILYSLIGKRKDGKQNIDLYLYDMDSAKSQLISSRWGINSGAIFLPQDENKIALTLSFTGNADIYILDLVTKSLTRLTNHYSDDVDPSVAADGKIMTFLSGRPGKAMIYTLEVGAEAEKNVKRISFIGRFNATPRFSPDGSEITFATWVDESFDIYRMHVSGSNLVRLTKNFGSNEDPTYSLDGQFIAFSSQRIISRKEAINNIYIMDRDGDILGAITQNMGNCVAPRWSK